MSKYNLFNTNDSRQDTQWENGGSIFRSGDSYANFDHGKTSIPIPKTGKWYQEFVHVGQRSNDPASIHVGIAAIGNPSQGSVGTIHGRQGYSLAKGTSSSQYYNYTSGGNGGAWNGVTGSTSLGDVYMIAVDMDNNYIWYGVNGAWLGSGDPANGTNQANTITETHHTFVFAAGRQTNDATRWSAMAVDPQGDTRYTPPAGFQTLTLDNVSIANGIDRKSNNSPGKAFNVIQYTGNGGEKSVTGVGFQPGLIWIKDHQSGDYWNCYDVGMSSDGFPSNRIYINANNQSEAGHLTSWDSDGFTVNTNNTNVNENGNIYTVYCWKNTATVANGTGGDISSTFWRDDDSGLSVFRYTGNGTNTQVIDTGLDENPAFVVIKGRDQLVHWPARHHQKTGGSEYLLFSSSQEAASVGPNAGEFDTGHFYYHASNDGRIVVTHGGSNNLNQVNRNGYDYIGWAFKEVEGVSKIGVYSGNGSTDGPFVTCGFQPAMVIVKWVGNQDWTLFDDQRDPVNNKTHYIHPSSNSAEGNISTLSCAFYSNGFKLTGGNYNHTNTAGTENYMFIAFARETQKYSNAVAKI